MRKYNLKLIQSCGNGYNFRKIRKKNDNILSVGVVVELKNGNVYISYKENEIKKCGFDKIRKIEIHRNSSLVCYENKVQNFSAKFPCFSSEGIYEIRTIIENSKDNLKTYIVNTFELFGHRKEVSCTNFEMNLSRIGKNLCMNFNKKFGNLDLSEISLSNITLFDSQNNQIKNIVCKMYARMSSIDFVILDIFDNDKSSKLIPNEVYVLKIFTKGREIVSSFSFEYDSIEMRAYRVVENIDHEIVSKLSDKAIFLKLYIKVNSLINVDDYDYFISNVRSRFLHFKSSGNEKNDIVVFECVIKNENGYFELCICKGNSVNVVRFNYDFTKQGEILIKQAIYFGIPTIDRTLNKYTIVLDIDSCEDHLNKIPFLGISDKFGQLSIGNRDRNFIARGDLVNQSESNSKVIFKDVSILNKFSEVYTVELDYEIKDSFVFSPSIGVKFNKIKFKSNVFNGNNIKIEYLTKGNLGSKYSVERDKECQIDIYENISLIEIKEDDLGKIVYLKTYDENNNCHFDTIILYDLELGPFVKTSNSEKYLLDIFNCLSVIDKSVFDYFNCGFEACVLSESGELIKEIVIHEFNAEFKIYFGDIEIDNGKMYYLRFSKGNFYRIYSFFVNYINEYKKVFIRNFDVNGMECTITDLSSSKSLCEIIGVNVFMIMGTIKYSIFEDSLSISSRNINIDSIGNMLVGGTEYFVQFNISRNGKRNILFTYIGESESLSEISGYMNELHDMLVCNLGQAHGSHADIVINAYKVFLNIDVSSYDKEFTLWERIIRDRKIDLRYFMKLFITECMLSNSKHEKYDMVDSVLKFLNIDNSLRDRILGDTNHQDFGLFVDEILDNVCNTDEYISIDNIFKGFYENEKAALT